MSTDSNNDFNFFLHVLQLDLLINTCTYLFGSQTSTLCWDPMFMKGAPSTLEDNLATIFVFVNRGENVISFSTKATYPPPPMNATTHMES